MREPSVEVFHQRTLANRVLTWIAATRPPFLLASVLPVLVGGALARHMQGFVSVSLLVLASVGILLVHAGANVLNDYFDAVSGADAGNKGRAFPFTGGSRFIQNGVLTLDQTGRLGAGLLLAGALIGLAAAWHGGPMFLAIGIAGGATAVAYSAPPCLACRGLGDVAIVVAFGLLPLAGTTLLLMQHIPDQAWWAGGVIGCFAAAILWANSIPDIDADRAVGKLTMPARLGAGAAKRVLPVWFVAGSALLIASPLPHSTWIMLLSAFPAAGAARLVLTDRLEKALPLVIMTHAAACGLLVLGLMLG